MSYHVDLMESEPKLAALGVYKLEQTVYAAK